MTLEFLNLPQNSIFRQFIPKKQFYEHGDLTTTEKNLFVNNIERITLHAQLTRDNTNIPVYKDDLRTYEEISVLLLELRSEDSLDRIVQIIMGTIPYPMIVVAKSLNKYCFFGAHQRDNSVEKSKIILEEIYHTDFLKENHNFIDKLDYQNLNKMNFHVLYDEFIQNLIAYNLEKRKIKQVDNQAEVLASIKEKEEKIHLLKNKLRKEKHFNKKMELNMQIKKIEQELKLMEDKHD